MSRERSDITDLGQSHPSGSNQQEVPDPITMAEADGFNHTTHSEQLSASHLEQWNHFLPEQGTTSRSQTSATDNLCHLFNNVPNSDQITIHDSLSIGTNIYENARNYTPVKDEPNRLPSGDGIPFPGLSGSISQNPSTTENGETKYKDPAKDNIQIKNPQEMSTHHDLGNSSTNKSVYLAVMSPRSNSSTLQKIENNEEQPAKTKATPALTYDDSFLWCDPCGKPHDGVCKQHGPLARIRDHTIPTRAKLTAPHYVTIKTIEMRSDNNHVYGVFARKVVQKRAQFGPYEGKLLDTWDHCRDDRLKLKLFNRDGSYKYMACSDQLTCNWMMFVQPAHSSDEQNIVAYQHQGHIYFTATKAIPPHKELKVWYSVEYGNWMNLNPLTEISKYSNNSEGNALEDNTHRELTMAGTEDTSPSLLSHIATSPAEKGDEVMDDKPSLTSSPQNIVTEPSLTSSQQKIVTVETHSDEEEAPVVNTHSADTFVNGNVDENISCVECGKSFNSVGECEAHSCVTLEMHAKEVKPEECPDVANVIYKVSGRGDKEDDGGRRTRSKRRGRPTKVKRLISSEIVGVDAIRTLMPKKRGRPPGSKNKMKILPMLPEGSKRKRLKPRKCKDDDDNDKLCKEKQYQSPLKTVSCLTAKVLRKDKAETHLYPCEQSGCDHVFASEKKLQIHMYNHTGERPFRCQFAGCDAAFNCKFKLRRHTYVHSTLKRHFCAYCEKGFARKDHLKNHMQVHNPNKKLYKCSTCDKEYLSSYAFRTHLTHHNIEQNDLLCAVCNERFEEKDAIMHHLKIHTGSRSIKPECERKQICPVCDKKFFTKKEVARHLVVHTQKRDFLCQFCPQTFGRKDHLVRHVNVHHGMDSGETTSEISEIKQTTPSVACKRKLKALVSSGQKAVRCVDSDGGQGSSSKSLVSVGSIPNEFHEGRYSERTVDTRGLDFTTILQKEGSNNSNMHSAVASLGSNIEAVTRTSLPETQNLFALVNTTPNMCGHRVTAVPATVEPSVVPNIQASYQPLIPSTQSMTLHHLNPTQVNDTGGTRTSATAMSSLVDSRMIQTEDGALVHSIANPNTLHSLSNTRMQPQTTDPDSQLHKLSYSQHLIQAQAQAQHGTNMSQQSEQPQPIASTITVVGPEGNTMVVNLDTPPLGLRDSAVTQQHGHQAVYVVMNQ